jgi:hypothetical protein
MSIAVCISAVCKLNTNPEFESMLQRKKEEVTKNYSAVVDYALQNSLYFGNLQLAIRPQLSDIELISEPFQS